MKLLIEIPDSFEKKLQNIKHCSIEEATILESVKRGIKVEDEKNK